MKTTSLLLLSLSYPLAIHAIPRNRAFVVVSKKPTNAKEAALKLRGGDLGPITGKQLANTMGVLAIGDALAGTIQPIDAWKKFGVTIEPGSKGEHYLGHGLGASAASLSVTSLLALSGQVSTDEAIAYGMLTRCAYMTEMLLTKEYEELGVPTLPHVTMYLILLFTAFGLLSGNTDYEALAKIGSILLAGHGGLLFLNPRIADDETEKKTVKVDGAYMFVSSLFAALLAFGIEPVAAMGYTSVFCIPLLLGVLDLVEVDELFGLSPQVWTIIIVLFMGASAYGMLA